VPRVSVIVPVYNSAPFLRESIQSVLSQNFHDFELIAIDDGSSDESWEILQSFEYDRRVKTIRFKNNQGAAVARNAGIAISDCDYLAFLDSDDIAKPRRLKIQVQALENDRSIDVVSGRAEIIHQGGRARGSSEQLSAVEIAPTLLFRNCIVHSSVILRRARWEPYRSEYAPAEDYDLWARIAPYQSFLPLNAVLLSYREHPHGISKRLSDRMKESVAAIHQLQLERLGVVGHVELHGRLTNWPADADALQLAEAEAWLLELLPNRFYHRASFRRVIEKIWFSICLDSWVLGPMAFQIYRRSRLARLTSGRLWHFARRFARRALLKERG
jgi:glycosyltransferase involved in cell wall biosynthesis